MAGFQMFAAKLDDELLAYWNAPCNTPALTVALVHACLRPIGLPHRSAACSTPPPDQIRENHEMLSQLDSAVGDGDHGTTILRAMEAVSKTVAENPASDLKTLFSAVAWAVMSCDGGSTGPLLGSFFMGMSDGAAGQRGAGLRRRGRRCSRPASPSCKSRAAPRSATRP